jgi:hypothetical protein
VEEVEEEEEEEEEAEVVVVVGEAPFIFFDFMKIFLGFKSR